MSVRDSFQYVAADIKVAAGVSATTTGVGAGTYFDYIPDDIGKLAALVGIILSLTLIYTHIKRGRLEREKLHLEMELMKQKRRSKI